MEALFKGSRGSRGAKGDKGAQGEQGVKGDKGAPLTPALRRAIAYLLCLAIALSGANLYWTSHEVSASHAAQVREQVTQQKLARHEMAAQEKQGQRTLHLLCTTLNQLAANQPPAGNPATNPARRYEQRNHAILAQLGPDIGCK